MNPKKENRFRIGLDIGSTTIKIVVLDKADNVLFHHYERHLSHVKMTAANLLRRVGELVGSEQVTIAITGSAGIGIAQWLQVPFVQEVIAGSRAVGTFIPETDIAVELGGEDAKLTYFGASLDQRMNGTCAGGTGAFIDQMAILLQTDAAGLNSLAKEHKQIYPIASRCGVFAKTDIQPLLNEGGSHEDIAASIFQAVINQTISGLAQGKPLKGKIAFLGGPLTFLPQLREQFIETLNLAPGEALVPENGQYFVAMGAALESELADAIEYDRVIERIPAMMEAQSSEVNRMEPLFTCKDEYDDFVERHNKHKVHRESLSDYSGSCFLGIDAGSTTTKAALIGSKGQLLYSDYRGNQGSPLKSTLSMFEDLFSKLPQSADLKYTGVTGYGEKLIKEALNIDIGEIETIAHFKAAEFFQPGVDFILDIGGQDMKALRIADGAVDEILLNDACSSGCGSFIETFAVSLEQPIEDFAKAALSSAGPIDLGTRCTVFMNSRVKQAQKEGCSVGDISAGLSYSVIKNALTKVIKLTDPSQLGEKIVVQGGTFYNDAVLRAFEKVSERIPVRPDIAGIMGAFGAALLAKARWTPEKKTSLIGQNDMGRFEAKARTKRCASCGNKCLLTINEFSDGRSFTTGNRCERGLGIEKSESEKLPNIYAYKYKRLFQYESIAEDKARAVVGLPRALNMYENYPFWHTFFTTLGYRVVLSRPSSKKVFENGMDTIPAESVCYPAKLVHGHIKDLIRKKVDIVFYPAIPFEQKEDEDAGNNYNCPIVAGYPELIRANMDDIKDSRVRYFSPFISMHDKERLIERLSNFSKAERVSKKEIRAAVNAGWAELENYKKDVRRKGDEILTKIRKEKIKTIILAGRPYHIDPEVNHGIPEMINEMGMAVLSEDAVSKKESIIRPMRVVDQWTYHTRLYAAAQFTAKNPEVELVQLNSFGCGIDAVTIDQVHEILHQEGRIYTVLKIDEGNQLGAARIRLRSLKAVMEERLNSQPKKPKPRIDIRLPFSKEMRKTHTIIAPQMAPIHFELVQEAFVSSGYNFEVLPTVSNEDVEVGLKFVNNDACYPSIIVIGQLINAVKSGNYDPETTAMLITQTGGGCRATNYIGFLKKGLEDAGFGKMPVISLNALGMDDNPGFKITASLMYRAVMGLVYGDLMMRLVLRIRPNEKTPGATERLYEYWMGKIKNDLKKPKFIQYSRNLKAMVKDFAEVEISDQKKPRVGLVGEILVKFHPAANNDIIRIIEDEGAEAVVPDLIDFFLYSSYNNKFKYTHLSGSLKGWRRSRTIINVLEFFRRPMVRALSKYPGFGHPERIESLAKKTKPVVSLGTQMGEGWFLTGEMIELIESGIPNVVCMQPFACLPNQVTGKGMIKALKDRYPESNISAIDYDPGTSEVNQLNRIKLMLNVAFRTMGISQNLTAPDILEDRTEKKKVVIPI